MRANISLQPRAIVTGGWEKSSPASSVLPSHSSPHIALGEDSLCLTFFLLFNSWKKEQFKQLKIILTYSTKKLFYREAKSTKNKLYAANKNKNIK